MHTAVPVPVGVVPVWRYAVVVSGVVLGLTTGLPAIFNGSLPFFMLPIAHEFGWGRGATAAAAVCAMLGLTLASPFAGTLFDRYGPEPVIRASVLLFSALMCGMALLPPSLFLFGLMCLVIGVAGSATSMIGYVSVLPFWFDRKLGLALGLGGIGVGLGVVVAPFISTHLISDVGWRRAYLGLAVIALLSGMLAYCMLQPARGRERLEATRATARALPTSTDGKSLREAWSDTRFWLLLAVTFAVAFAVMGIALHLASLYQDRGLSMEQAAAGAALAGGGAIVARLAVGILLDRFHAPFIAAGIFLAAGLGLVLDTQGQSFIMLSAGTFLGGSAMGAEGDLLPFLVRRYFGMRAFGVIFGVLHASFTLGAVLGPIAYGMAFDRVGNYSAVMQTCAALCALSALAVLAIGPYRYGSER